MIQLPLFESLIVRNYGLFPGLPASPGLDVVFRPGLTLILGSNGLGKSTLVGIMYRLLTGPFDLPGLASRHDLGGTRLEPVRLTSSSREAFASRVADRAASARACLTFALGSATLTVERSLKDLSLISFSIDGKPQSATEDHYQQEIVAKVGVWSFADWLLILGHLVFYFEERRALVWDATAQRQLLRALFLSPATAQRWTESEREILSIDSRRRNLSAVLHREQQELVRTEARSPSTTATIREIEALQGLQDVDVDERSRLDDRLAEASAERASLRQRLLVSQQNREDAFREVEHARLVAIGARFPSRSETARYILAQLITDAECLVCGTHAPLASAEYTRRLDLASCVVCASPLADFAPDTPALADVKLSRSIKSLASTERALEADQLAFAQADRRHAECLDTLANLEAAISERGLRIDALARSLPKALGQVHAKREELSAMRGNLEVLDRDLSGRRDAFAAFINEVSQAMVAHADAVKASFHAYAHGFLLESCDITWSPRPDRVGQTGPLMSFPNFDIDMTGTDFPAAVRRSGPENVSESQREFIDLSFRMALVSVASATASGSLVVDAPESSLDAVFVRRAAAVLSSFSEERKGNRLVVTSNILEGELIPLLLEGAGSDAASRVIDLLKVATPTAAVRELRDEYDAVMVRLLTPRAGTLDA